MKWHGMLACEQFHFSWCLLYKKLIRTKLLWAREHLCSSVCVWVENGSRKEYAFIYVLVTYCTAWAAGTIPVWRCRSYITTVFIKKCFNTDSFLAPVWLFVGEKKTIFTFTVTCRIWRQWGLLVHQSKSLRSRGMAPHGGRNWPESWEGSGHQEQTFWKVLGCSGGLLCGTAVLYWRVQVVSGLVCVW